MHLYGWLELFRVVWCLWDGGGLSIWGVTGSPQMHLYTLGTDINKIKLNGYRTAHHFLRDYITLVTKPRVFSSVLDMLRGDMEYLISQQQNQILDQICRMQLHTNSAQTAHSEVLHHLSVTEEARRGYAIATQNEMQSLANYHAGVYHQAVGNAAAARSRAVGHAQAASDANRKAMQAIQHMWCMPSLILPDPPCLYPLLGPVEITSSPLINITN